MNQSWTENAIPGDSLTFVALTPSMIHQEGVAIKPHRLPLEVGNSYLLFSEGGYILAYGVPGIGFYRLMGCGACGTGDWFGWSISPTVISSSELDTLAAHIGNNPHLDSREWIGSIAFPSGERLSIESLIDLCSDSTPVWDTRITPYYESRITFHIETAQLISDSSLHTSRNGCRSLPFFSVVDSCVSNRFYVSLLPRGSVISSRGIPTWIKGIDKPLIAYVTDYTEELECPGVLAEPTSIEFSDNSTIRLNMDSVVMVDHWSWSFTEIPYPIGSIEFILQQVDSNGCGTNDPNRVVLRFPDLDRRPAIPDVFIIETALCTGKTVLVELLHADSLGAKLSNVSSFGIALSDSVRFML
ncbi:MAG: hypothetical protein QUS11_07255 [Candidatus Fermentibacter sp.]|nr:hypothetical protein [Candidatus Fermentibacter sp.]